MGHHIRRLVGWSAGLLFGRSVCWLVGPSVFVSEVVMQTTSTNFIRVFIKRQRNDQHDNKQCIFFFFFFFFFFLLLYFVIACLHVSVLGT